jgi:hypothetical protein
VRNDRVAPGRYRPGAPTDPYVRALAHTVPLIMDSLRDWIPSRTLGSAIRFCFVDTMVEFRCIRRVSQKRFHESASRFPPLAPAGCCSPTSSVLSRRYDALPPSRRTSFPSLGGTSVALVAFAPWRPSAPPEPGVGNPVLQPGIRRGANRVLPSSRGTTIVRLHMFSSDAGGTACTRPLKCSSVAPERPSAEAPTFRTFDAQ